MSRNRLASPSLAKPHTGPGSFDFIDIAITKFIHARDDTVDGLRKFYEVGKV